MNVNQMKTIVALLSVSALLITTGCGGEGEAGEAYETAEYGNAEFAILRADTSQEHIRVPVDQVLAVDLAGQENPFSAVLGLYGELPDSHDLNEMPEVEMDNIPDAAPTASMLNLKSNGPVCADMDTWKEFSHQSCEIMGGHLKAIVPGGECGENFYAGTTFLCTFLNTNGDEIDAVKMQSFTVGGRGTCKPYSSFVEYAAHLCNGEENLREKHILGSCDLGTSEEGFSAVRYTCEV
jgi:hypothetical protein